MLTLQQHHLEKGISHFQPPKQEAIYIKEIKKNIWYFTFRNLNDPKDTG